jgi:hypothetical protein
MASSSRRDSFLASKSPANLFSTEKRNRAKRGFWRDQTTRMPHFCLKASATLRHIENTTKEQLGHWSELPG